MTILKFKSNRFSCYQTHNSYLHLINEDQTVEIN